MATRRRGFVLTRLVGAIRTATRPGSPGLWVRIQSLPRLVSATLRGEYAGTSVLRLAGLAAATAYVVSPVDLLPEALLGVFGLVDDTFVMAWLASTLVEETEGFLTWERATTWERAQAGQRAWAWDEGQAGVPPMGTSQTVRSHVVR